MTFFRVLVGSLYVSGRFPVVIQMEHPPRSIGITTGNEGYSRCVTKADRTSALRIHCISVIPLSDAARNQLKGGF